MLQVKMIKDKIENIYRYSLNEHFEDFKAFLKQSSGTDFTKLIAPLRAIPLEYKTGEFNLSQFENHQKFIDIHYIVDGEEHIGLNSLENLVSNLEYDPENDYQLFDGRAKEIILLGRGEFLLLFPGEVHVTGGFINELSQELKKVVFKVPINDGIN